MNQQDVFSVVKKNLFEVLPFLAGKEIAITDSLKDLGANSVDRVEIVTLSMEDLNIMIPPNEFGNVKNLGGLVELLHTKLNGSTAH